MGRIGAFFSDIADTLGLEDKDKDAARGGVGGGSGSGYDPDRVCTRCYGMLQGMFNFTGSQSTCAGQGESEI